MQSHKMDDSDTKEPLSNISDSSFIILGQGSLPPSISSEAMDAEFSDENQNTFVVFEGNKSPSNRNTPSRTSDSHSLEDSFQEKLKQLLRENNQLKETLIQNNLAIRSQLDTFYMWQQEVLKTHKSHKEKFLETKDLILKLRAENLNLRKQLTDGFCTIGNDDLVTGINEKPDFDNLKQEAEKLKITCEDLMKRNEILEMENSKLREKSQLTEKEVLRLNGELTDVMKENEFLKQKSNELCKCSAGNHELLLNTETQTEISNLIPKEKFTKDFEEISKGQASVLEKENEYLKDSDNLRVSFDCQNKNFSTLQSWLTLGEENLGGSNQNLLGEIKELKCHITQEEKTHEQEQENLQELKGQFNRLLEDYKALEEQLSVIQNKGSNSEKGTNEVINLSQQLEAKEKELLLKQQECSELKEENKKLNSKCEELAVLKIQLELYQSDFNEERAAREKLAGEKEAMAEQLRHLRSKLEALEKGPKEEKDKPKGDESKSFFRPYEGGKGRFLCPKCMFSFGDLRRCQEHIEECLNTHFYP